MADFIHRLAAALALEEQTGDGHDDTRYSADIAIGMNHATRNVNTRRLARAGINEPTFYRPGRTGTVVPQINAKIRRAGKNKISS